MGPFLLSIASAETVSWIGFVVLGFALLGEVGVILIPPRWETLHKELAFGFAVLAAAGYALERVGDEAIIKELEKRATSAEAKFAQRTLSDNEIGEMAQSLEQYAPQEFVLGAYGNEPSAFGSRVKTALEKAGWKSPFVRYPPTMLKAGATGIEVWVNPGDRSTEEAAEKLTGFLRGKAMAAVLKTFDPPSPNMTAKIGIYIADRF